MTDKNINEMNYNPGLYQTREETTTMNPYLKIYDLKQLCKILHIGRNTAYNLINNKEIYAIKSGGGWKIPEQSILDYIKRGLTPGNVTPFTNADTYAILNSQQAARR